jgi:hypothetical protein|tara:strand:+ start:44 stop:1378 length:1335 start_codon:yes stop_codon:yes gene_type:complete
MKRGYDRRQVADALMSPSLPRSLANTLSDPALDRATILPVGRRTFTDPGDDITEERSLEFALPGLLYDPLMGAARVSDMFAGAAPINPNAVTQFMIDAPLAGGVLSAATGAAPRGAVLGANVFHGGPHRFAPEPDFPHGRPRLDKIGTGEGHQAYGYGFYSAESPGVAESYKDTLGGSAGVSVGGPKIGGAWRGDQSAQAIFSSAVASEGSVDAAVKSLRKNIKEMEDGTSVYKNYVKVGAIDQNRFDDMLGQFKDALKWHDASADSITYVPAGGTLYKLDIPDADVAKYLDYDKPLSEQPKSVRKALANMVSVSAADRKQITKEIKALQARLNDPWVRRSGGAEMSNKLRDEIQELKAVLLDDSLTGGEFYKGVVTGLGGRKDASEALRDIGIPGLKYFDQGSRAGGEGTRNYVTWDQNVLDRSKMLERDGQDLAKVLMEVEP